MTPEVFTQIADLLPEPTLLLSSGGEILAANTAVESRLGYHTRAVVGRYFADLVVDPPNDVDRYLEACAHAQTLTAGAMVVRGPDTHRIPCRCEGALVSEPDDEFPRQLLVRLVPRDLVVGQFLALNQRIMEMSREIQRRVNAEQALRRQEQWWRVTLASVGDAVIVTDARSRVLTLNAVARAITGWNESDAVGRSLDEVLPLVDENTQQPVTDIVSRTIASDGIVELRNQSMMLAASEAGVRYIDDSAAPIKDEHGDLLGVVLVFRDVTERRRVERAIRESEAQFRQLADALPQLVWTARPDGYIDYGNERWYELTGLSRTASSERSWRQFLHPDDAERHVAAYDECILKGDLLEIESRFLDGPRGEYRWFLTRAYPVRDAAGTLIRWFGTCTDVDDAKRAAEALKDADRRKDEFLAFLAHELRNPLAPIRNSIEILRLSGNDPALIERARSILDRQVQQMVRLIDDLLDLSRISTGRLELRREHVDLRRVLQSAVETSRPVIESHGQVLTIALPTEAIVLDADTTRLSQVFSNLLNNSAKYSEPGGRITLTAERRGSEVIVTVKDTGVGISPGDLARIFDLFTQVDASPKRAQDGLGVGLSLVQRLVHMHGGEIEARSEGPNCGSEFVVRLPTVADVPNAAAEERLADEDTRDLRTRVLVADDYRDSADSLTVMLRHFGADVRTAYDGQQAVDVAEDFRPDVVLLDLGMPKLSGYDAARRIAQRPWSHDVAFIALTGWGQDADRDRTRDAGFHYHLVKPVEFAALHKLLKSLRPTALQTEQRLTTR